MSRPFYALKQALKQMIRNKNMLTASIFSITAMMIVLGLFFVLAVNANIAAESAKGQFDTISIYLYDEETEDIQQESANDLAVEIRNIEGVSNVEYLSKEDAMLRMMEKWGENGYLLNGLSQNPFPASLEVELSDIGSSENVVAGIQRIDNESEIEEIVYSQSAVDKLLKVTSFIQKGALILIIILIIVSVVVVSNTVKLTVNAREREITIMKYVGATNWFIRGPFLLEGILIGILSSVIATGVIGLGYYKIIEAFGTKLLSLFSVTFVPTSYLIVNLSVIFISIGCAIGALGSILSMRKFLDK